MEQEKRQNQAYRHHYNTYDNTHIFYYHKECIDQNPPGAEVVFELIDLEKVPPNAQCDFCYELVQNPSGYHLRGELKQERS